MRAENPIETLHEALAAAIHRDLPDIHYQDRDWDKWRKMTKEEQGAAFKDDTKMPRVARTRRPSTRDVEVIMFAQTWGSTALGYGGMGGAAMTGAYTVIVRDGNVDCVYFGYGRLAYSIPLRKITPEQLDNYRNDIKDQSLMSCKNAPERYGATKGYDIW